MTDVNLFTDDTLCTLIRNWFYPRQNDVTVRMERIGARCRVYAHGIDENALSAAVLSFRHDVILRVWGTNDEGECFVGYDERRAS